MRTTQSRQGCNAQPNFPPGIQALRRSSTTTFSLFSRQNACMCADSINGQWILILYGVHRPGVWEKAKSRLVCLVNPGHTFFNVSQGKFGLFPLRILLYFLDCFRCLMLHGGFGEKMKESALMKQWCFLFIRPVAPTNLTSNLSLLAFFTFFTEICSNSVAQK